MTKMKPFNPMVPDVTRVHFLKMETPHREILCLHKNEKTEGKQNERDIITASTASRNV